MQNNCSLNEQYYFNGGDEGLRLIQPYDKEKKIAAIIVSFCGGGSYDELFTTV